MMIPKDEQINAILNGREWALASKYCDGNVDLLASICTITETDLIEYVKLHGFPSGWLWTSNETYDGLYILGEGDGWIVYEKERGKIYEETKRQFSTYDEALAYVITTYYMPK
jgi:hypothetical protein